VRIFGEPIGLLNEAVPPKGLDPHELACVIAREFGPTLRERMEDCGLSWPGELPTAGLQPPRVPRFLESRERVLREGPQMTIAVCTRDRTDGLRTLLESLRLQEYRRLRVLVVDNAPSDQRTRRLVADLSRDGAIDYTMEPRPGLSWARNRAIEASDGEVIAWTDDDATCDPWWAAELARGFVDVPSAAAVTGAVIPSELETQSQVWHEQFCGVRRGRGFTRAVFSPATAQSQSPLYPQPQFGNGNNMAFRREALVRIGGFDCALGAGTATEAGEDTAALSALLLAGGTVVYQPSAIVRHCDRRDYAALCRLQLGYGRGMGAFYASVLAHQPGYALEMLRLAGPAVRHQLSRRARRVGELDEDVRHDLLRAFHIGLLQGPFLYLGARRRVRRLGAAMPKP